jgi:hypothetical protein
MLEVAFFYLGLGSGGAGGALTRAKWSRQEPAGFEFESRRKRVLVGI